MVKLFSSATYKIIVCLILILHVSEDTLPLRGLAKIKILIVLDLISFYRIMVPLLSRIKICIYEQNNVPVKGINFLPWYALFLRSRFSTFWMKLFQKNQTFSVSVCLKLDFCPVSQKC